MRNSLSLWKSDKWNPWKEMLALQKNFDQMLNPFSSAPVDEINAGFWSPACDLTESDMGFTLTFDLAGVPKEDIKVEAFENKVRVSGEKKYSHEEKNSTRHITERFNGRFERSFTLPTKIDIDKVDAQYKNGVLSLTVPKASGIVSRQVKIADKAEGPTTTRVS